MIEGARIPIDEVAATAVLAEQPIARAWLYGSVITDRFDEFSDVDVMVEVERPEACAAGVNVAALIAALTALFGREVDVVVAHRMNPHYAQMVRETGVTLYERTERTERTD